MITTTTIWDEVDVPEAVEQFFEYVADADEVDEGDLVSNRGYACEFTQEGHATFVHFGYYVPEVDEEMMIGDWEEHFYLAEWADPDRDTSALFVGDYNDFPKNDEESEWERRIVEVSEERMEPVVEAFRDEGMFEWRERTGGDTFDYPANQN